MTRPARSIALAPRFLAALVVLCSASGSAQAQLYQRPFDPVASAIAQFPLLRNLFEAELPGSTDPASPYVGLPGLRGELGVKPIFISLTQGKFRIADQGISLDLKQDLGLVDQGVLVEFSGRAQLGRFGARVLYDGWLRTFRGKEANLDWPNLRVGADVELFRRSGFCLGASMDINWERPTFSVSKPGVVTSYLEWPRPVTWGVYASYNPPSFCGISTSLEAKYRGPLRTGTKVTEFEIAGGFRTPETVLGTSAFRAGWRYTQLEHDSRGTEITADWSGVFGEYVFFF